MTPKMKIAAGLGVLICVAGVGYLYTHQKQLETFDTRAPLASVSGNVVSANVGTREVVISTSGVQNTLRISPATRIQKFIEQKSKKGVLEKQAAVEVNIDALSKGTAVDVTYLVANGPVLSGVATISFTVNGNVDAYYTQAAKDAKTGTVTYQKAQVVRLDDAAHSLQYKVYIFSTLGTKVITAFYPSGTPVYRVEDPTRVGIIHARIPASHKDLQSGTPLFLMLDNQAFQKGSVVPLAFILIPA